MYKYINIKLPLSFTCILNLFYPVTLKPLHSIKLIVCMDFFFIQDRQHGVLNRTLIIDNNNRQTSAPEINFPKWEADGGRTWLLPNETDFEFEEVHILRKGELALHPDVIK